MNFKNKFNQSVTITSFTDSSFDSQDFAPVFHSPSPDCPASLLHILCSGSNLSDGFFTLSSGLTDCFLILYTYEGNGKLKNGTQTLELYQNSLLLMDCTRIFSLQPAILPWKFRLFFLDTEFLSVYRSMLLPDNQPLVYSIPARSPIPHYVHLLSDIPENYFPADAFAMHQHLTDLFCTLARETSDSRREVSPEIPFYLSEMKRHLEKNYSHPFQLTDFEQQYKISKYRLCREFSARFGKPPLQYLNHVRIGHAKEMLLTTDLSIHEISSLVGYENPTHFINLFKKNTGMTPGIFRKHYR